MYQASRGICLYTAAPRFQEVTGSVQTAPSPAHCFMRGEEEVLAVQSAISLLPYLFTPVGPMHAPQNLEHDKLLSIRHRCVQCSPFYAVDTGYSYLSPAALVFMTVWDMVSGSATSDQ
jgi:hypothetical protein